MGGFQQVIFTIQRYLSLNFQMWALQQTLSITGGTWPWAPVSQLGVPQHHPGQANSCSSQGQAMPPSCLQQAKSSNISKNPTGTGLAPLTQWAVLQQWRRNLYEPWGPRGQGTFPHTTICEHLIQDMHPEGRCTFLQTPKQYLCYHHSKSQLFKLFFLMAALAKTISNPSLRLHSLLFLKASSL